MTAIAWDGTTLAADTLSVMNGLKRKTHKIVSTPNYLYGMTGFESECMRVAAWVKGGADEKDAPRMDDDGEHGILIDRSTKTAYVLCGKSCAKLPILDVGAITQYLPWRSGRAPTLPYGSLLISTCGQTTRSSRWTHDES